MKRKTVLLIMWILIGGLCQGQFEDQTSSFKYYYQLNAHDTKELLKSESPKIELKHLHSLVDSIPIDSVWRVDSYGTFLEVMFEKNILNANLISNVPFEVNILDNQTDLAMQVLDLEGIVISKAKIRVNKKNVPFDNKCNCYRLRKSNRKGVLSVEALGELVHLPLQRQFNNSRLKRIKNGLLYQSPLKYAVLPIRYVVNLPIDGYQSIKHSYAQGTIRGTADYFESLYRKTACIFDEYFCEDLDQKIDGYMVFSQPKYRLGDSLKMKAFLVKNKKRAWSKPVVVELIEGYRKTRFTDTVELKRPGVFLYDMQLVEGLGIKLDQKYMIRISDLKNRTMMQSSFQLEDYELSGIELEVEGVQKKHFAGNPMELMLKGTDENKLPLYDARYEVMGITKIIQSCADSMTSVADTLFHIRSTFEESGTKIQIPDSVFHSCQIDYDLIIKMRTADNDKIEESHVISYRSGEREISHSIVDSAVVFQYEEDGKRTIDKPIDVSFFRSNQLVRKEGVDLPFKYSGGYHIDKLIFEGDRDFKEIIRFADIDNGINISGNRTMDSVQATITNPLGISISYFLYRNNKEITSGTQKEIKISIRDQSKANYSLMISYSWGGKMMNKGYTLGIDRSKLNVQMEQPRSIFPGQVDTLSIIVKDATGEPVSGIDVTAFGMTDKFGYDLPYMPEVVGIKNTKKFYNQYSSNDSAYGIKQEVDYWQRNSFPELKEKEYYQLIMPGNRIYRKTVQQPDGVTQFAPFVVDRGEIKYCNIIYVDGRPIYFAWNSINAPYSFKISPGVHTITLRTDDAEIEIKDVRITGSLKTILSIDQAFSSDQVTIKPRTPFLTEEEKKFIYPYVFPYTISSDYGLSTIHSYGKYFQLLDKNYSEYSRYWETNFSGPIIDRDIRIENHERDYYLRDRFEPGYLYTYKKEFLKLKELEDYSYPQSVNQEIPWDFYAQPLSRMCIDSIVHKREKGNRKLQYSYSRKKTQKGNGKIRLVGKHIDEIQHIVILNNSNYKDIRLLRGRDNVIHDLDPGLYSLIGVWSDKTLFEIDDIDVVSNHSRVINVSKYERSGDPDKYKVLDKILDRFMSNGIGLEGRFLDSEIHQVRSQMKSITRAGAKRTISGVVYDGDTDEPLIGAIIYVQGTDIGASTDIDGAYEIHIPEGAEEQLVCTYLGYTDHLVNVGVSDFIDIRLSENCELLDEVVVTGLGRSYKRKNAIATLQGKVEGVQIANNHGQPRNNHNIVIRGASSLQTPQDPLIILNGVLVQGTIGDVDPSVISLVEVLKGSEAVSLYGSRATNGVIIITTTNTVMLEGLSALTLQDDLTMIAQSTEFSIRSNFKDNAFWKPSMTTNKDGRVSFIVEFPDDVTSWKTYAIAMDEKLRSGTATGKIRSFKPLLAELKLPRFMTAGDLVKGIGSIKNYSGDSLKVRTKFLNNEKEWNGEISLSDNYIDTLEIKVPSNLDSLTYEFTVCRDDGYMDGERRKVMVQPLGIEKPVGHFFYLSEEMDTTLNVSVEDSLGAAMLRIDNSDNAYLLSIVDFLESYKYGCNEQLASRLIGHLVRYRICEEQGLKCGSSKGIRKLIKQILANQNDYNHWAWYGKGDSSASWATNHVVKALRMARDFGFEVEWNSSAFLKGAQLQFDTDSLPMSRMFMVEALLVMGDTMASIDLFSRIELRSKAQFDEIMQYAATASSLGMSINKYIDAYLKISGVGHRYISPPNEYRWYGFKDISYIHAYVAMQKSKEYNSKDVIGVRNHYNRTSRDRWMNTYSSSLWLYYNWKQLLETSKSPESIKLIVDSKPIVIDDFPFSIKVDEGFIIEKQKGFDLYVSTKQSYWDHMSSPRDGFFEVNTVLKQFDESVDALKAGEEAKLVVNLKVAGDAEQVILRIPIPASCSYSSKPQRFRHSVHAEYFREEVAIFYDRLPDGNYKLEISLMPRFTGEYNTNASQAYMMYNPENQGNNGVKRIIVE